MRRRDSVDQLVHPTFGSARYASPDMQASPIKMVEALWRGTLPTFDSIEDINELVGARVMGLWNRLPAIRNGRRPSG